MAWTAQELHWILLANRWEALPGCRLFAWLDGRQTVALARLLRGLGISMPTLMTRWLHAECKTHESFPHHIVTVQATPHFEISTLWRPSIAQGTALTGLSANFRGMACSVLLTAAVPAAHRATARIGRIPCLSRSLGRRRGMQSAMLCSSESRGEKEVGKCGTRNAHYA